MCRSNVAYPFDLEPIPDTFLQRCGCDGLLCHAVEDKHRLTNGLVGVVFGDLEEMANAKVYRH